MVCCGKKTSLICMFIAFWGAAQLLLMGLLFAYHSLGLITDLPISQSYETMDQFREDADAMFLLLAWRCTGAGIFFLVIFLLAFINFCINRWKESRKPLYR